MTIRDYIVLTYVGFPSMCGVTIDSDGYEYQESTVRRGRSMVKFIKRKQ